jgi:hypothetical protein
MQISNATSMPPSPDTTLPFGWALYRHFRNRELDRSSVWTGLAMIQNRDFADADERTGIR